VEVRGALAPLPSKVVQSATPDYSMNPMAKGNRLAQETSPYLQQHANNPVDWYPWGDEGLGRARREKKPIFLSIGYSACHWCHVMEHESFEDEETAAYLNEHFISIKVDREERPDIDHIYMTAVQAMTQHGGWPLTVFLTPELQPFYGGTYFPKEDRHGLPSFKKILLGVANAWKTKSDEVRKSAQDLAAAVENFQRLQPAAGDVPALNDDFYLSACKRLVEHYDPDFGGLGNSPKFFHSTDFRYLLRQSVVANQPELRQPVGNTLRHWTNGGIYDQLGGGFHRYSTDRVWLVPHFEKMLYDNSLLVPLFLEAYQLDGNPEYARIARETLDYLLREMHGGAFYATQDADSEGVEGKFFVWERAELKTGLDADLFSVAEQIFNLPEHGNWEEKIILARRQTVEQAAAALKLDPAWVEDNLAVLKNRLLAIRAERIAPHTDKKIITAWNGMCLTAFAKGYAVLGNESYRTAAEETAAYLLDKLAVREGTRLTGLWHTYKDGIAKVPGFLDDYAYLVDGLLSLFQVTFDVRWVDTATEVASLLVSKFWDESSGGFYYSSAEHRDLLTRVRDGQDGATPSGTSMAFTALVRLAHTTGITAYDAIIEKGFKALQPTLERHPSAFSQLLTASFEWHHPHTQWVTICSKGKVDEAREAARERFGKFHPNFSRWVVEESLASRIASRYPVLSKRTLGDGEVRHFVCRDFVCTAPTENESKAAKEAGL